MLFASTERLCTESLDRGAAPCPDPGDELPPRRTSLPQSRVEQLRALGFEKLRGRVRGDDVRNRPDADYVRRELESRAYTP